MKIIDIGVCVNNVDPKGIGRIRYRPYGDFVSEVEGSIKYEEWDEKDPFIALPFLPHHINIIPQIRQSVKLIQYDTKKDYQNTEYISGPYTSPHDVQNQTFTAQHKGTTFGGVIVKGLKDIRNKNGGFNSPVTRGVVIDNKDTGFKGNYGSDIIFTENGVQLRGGMLYSKESKKQGILDYPQLAKKMGKVALKKFPSTYKYSTETIDSSKVAVNRLRFVVEYEIDNLTAPSQLNFFVYETLGSYGTLFNTDVFGESSILPDESSLAIKLINTGNTLTGATYTIPLNGTIQSAYVEARNLISLMDKENLTSINSTYPNVDMHPFYFRPTSDFQLSRGSNATEASNKATFLSKVEVRKITGGYGLIYSRSNINPPIIPNKRTINIAKEIKGAGEQSFSYLGGDKVYLISTSPNVGVNVKSINFNELDEYELTQEDYVARIEPNTYAMVRGENLYNLLIALKKAFDSHVHNINDPCVKTEDNYVEFNKLMDTLLDDILNNSIRIN